MVINFFEIKITIFYISLEIVNSFSTQSSNKKNISASQSFANSHYALLGLHPSASVIEIRKVYRELSKLYHPDTTNLTTEEAKQKFQQLNEAYRILSNPERRSLYDLQIGYSRWNVIQSPYDYSSTQNYPEINKSAYLDPTDRPLSSGELFALLLMALTLLGCLLLALFIAWLRNSIVY